MSHPRVACRDDHRHAKRPRLPRQSDGGRVVDRVPLLHRVQEQTVELETQHRAAKLDDGVLPLPGVDPAEADKTVGVACLRDGHRVVLGPKAVAPRLNGRDHALVDAVRVHRGQQLLRPEPVAVDRGPDHREAVHDQHDPPPEALCLPTLSRIEAMLSCSISRCSVAERPRRIIFCSSSLGLHPGPSLPNRTRCAPNLSIASLILYGYGHAEVSTSRLSYLSHTPMASSVWWYPPKWAKMIVASGTSSANLVNCCGRLRGSSPEWKRTGALHSAAFLTSLTTESWWAVAMTLSWWIFNPFIFRSTIASSSRTAAFPACGLMRA